MLFVVPWLRRTGQLWKLVVVALGMMPISLWPFTGWFRDVRWTALAAVVLAWFFAAVRCPRCGGRPVWALATRVDFRQFDRRLFDAMECPLCHDGKEQPPPLFDAYRRM